MDDQNFSVAPDRDMSRQDATDTDKDFSLSLEQAAELYARAGHPRTPRSLQRYCVIGHLEARKIATMTGDKYLVTPQSVTRHIAQIVELTQLDAVATGRDMSRQFATAIAPEIPASAIAIENGSKVEPDMTRHAATEAMPPVMEDQVPSPEPRHEAATGRDAMRQAATESVPPVMEATVHPQEPRHDATTAHDTSRQVATEPAATAETSRYVAHLERQLEAARDERDFLREQLNRKDKTIDALLERDKETNYLVRGLQEMLTPLLGGGRRREEPPTYTQ